MKRIYVPPMMEVVAMEMAHVIAASGDANIELPNGGHTDFDSNKRGSGWEDWETDDKYWNTNY